MKAHLIDTHLLVPRSRSSAKVKVKYQGHVSQKMDVLGTLVFHKHILFSSHFILWSANALNLGQCKIVSFVQQLNHMFNLKC